MDWLKYIPDDHLIEVAEGVLSGLADAVREYRAAKLHVAMNPDNEAAKVRFGEAAKFVRERLDTYDSYSAELRRRGLK